MEGMELMLFLQNQERGDNPDDFQAMLPRMDLGAGNLAPLQLSCCPKVDK